MIAESTCVVAALDCSFINKSGDKTYGLGKYWNGKQGKAERGLEISTLAIVDVGYKTAYHVSTQQTPPHCAANETRVDEYVRHFNEDCWALPKQVRYVVTDAYYTKTLITEAILEKGLHQIGKLRHDANLRYLYQGPQKAKGRPRQYDGKFKLGETARLSFVAHQEGVDIYTAVVNCVHLKQAIRLVYVEKKLAQGTKRALLFSTDTSLDALSLYRYYQARFQIEFLFRDAKQFTGLGDCQARSEQALYNHFNASFTALNLLKWQDRQMSPQRTPISIASWKRRCFNVLFMERIFSNSAFDLSFIKSTPAYHDLCNFGEIKY